MKSIIKKLAVSSFTVVALLGGAVKGYSQNYINLIVDTNQTWIGYMNVFTLADPAGYGNVGGYLFGSAWGTADLDASFSGTNAILGPNTSACKNSLTDPYWFSGQGTGTTNSNVTMDALFYVQNDSLNSANNLITFSGTCLSNNLIFPYQTVAFIKELAPDYSSQVQFSSPPLVAGQPFSIFYNPSGTVGGHIQYGFETIGPDANTNSVSGFPASYYGQVVVATQSGDPSLKPLASQSAVQTQKSVAFSATEIGTSPFTNRWQQITQDGLTTNTLSNGAKYSGVTSSSLTISNITLADAGTYVLNVTNSKGNSSVSATLVVVPLTTAQTNLLVDPSFESDNSLWAVSPTIGWVNFNGAAFQNDTDYYYNTGTLISVYDGTNCVQVYPQGIYNGVYQDRPAYPGQIFTAYSHAFSSSLDPLSGSDVYFMEVKFLDAGGNTLQDYQSGYVNTNSPLDTWMTLQPTNILGGGTAAYMTAPTNTVTVRAQGTYYCPYYESGSVYVDYFVLKLRSPVVAANISGSSIRLSFPTVVGPAYNVYYRTSLSSGSWLLLTSTLGDGTVKTVSDGIGSAPKFYYVQTTQ